MNAAVFYRSRSRWLFWIALACAAAIHLGAVVLARGKSDKVVVQDLRSGVDVEVLGVEPEQTPPEESVIPPRQLAPQEETFPEESRTLISDRPHRKTRTASALSGPRATFGSVKTLAMYAPRPVYPYEARRQRMVGSGIALLTVNPATGNVTGVRMKQSCGNIVLDNASLDALRRWRFKPGSVLSVEVPITYTLTGVSY
jgi:TonB family protein